MSVRFYVFDTSYLIELANCGRDADPKATPKVRTLFAQATKAGARFVVPLPCLFELGNHIADVGHRARREQLGKWLLETVQESLEKEHPWIIAPAGDPKTVLPGLMAAFSGLGVAKQIGLVDLFTITEAHSIKERHKDLKPIVHIWTNDRALKAQEPDKETNPYHWP